MLWNKIMSVSAPIKKHSGIDEKFHNLADDVQ